MTTTTDTKDLFGLPPTSQRVKKFVSSLYSLATTGHHDEVKVKAYPDAVFVNYYALGFSIEYRPTNGYKPSPNTQSIEELQTNNLALDKIDIYNHLYNDEPNATPPPRTKSNIAPTFARYPDLPFMVTFSLEPKSISVSAGTTGKDFVAALGEPDRKGGGTGLSSESISIWCEWTKEGVMVEFGGQDARAWDTGGDARWKLVSLFTPLPPQPSSPSK